MNDTGINTAINTSDDVITAFEMPFMASILAMYEDL